MRLSAHQEMMEQFSSRMSYAENINLMELNFTKKYLTPAKMVLGDT